MLELKRSRERAAKRWPLPSPNETLSALAELAASKNWVSSLVGLRRSAGGGSNGGENGSGDKSEGEGKGEGTGEGTGEGKGEGEGEGEGYDVEWLAVTALSNVGQHAPTTDLRDAARWFEGVSVGSNMEADAVGSALRGWQCSSSWTWMEALEEVVAGTAGCILSGALLTMAVLLLFTRSAMLACTTIPGVLFVLLCFVGYLVQRG